MCHWRSDVCSSDLGRIDIPSPGGREGAVKYTDYAIGRFIDEASTRAWFADTLFVIVADHDASVAGRVHLPVERYHIPLIFYAPELLAPAVNERLMSQMDIVPTLLDAMGSDGVDRFFGPIGRASCRDRVCQDWAVPVVAVSLKETNNISIQ